MKAMAVRMRTWAIQSILQELAVTSSVPPVEMYASHRLSSLQTC